jgi:uncharacterized membrane protein YtjA (UPF0391 family)
LIKIFDFFKELVTLSFITMLKSIGGFMLRWALTFFIIAIIAALFGFGGIAATASGIAQILFYIFLVLFIIALIFGLLGGRTPTPPI